jgi:hypothetical protein
MIAAGTITPVMVISHSAASFDEPAPFTLDYQRTYRPAPFQLDLNLSPLTFFECLPDDGSSRHLARNCQKLLVVCEFHAQSTRGITGTFIANPAGVVSGLMLNNS